MGIFKVLKEIDSIFAISGYISRGIMVLIFVFVFASSTFSQEQNFWHVLADVSYETKPSEQNGFQIDSPKFGKRVSQWNGKKITLKGYLIPLSEMGGKQAYMLSSLPFNSCFFCGGAGPETVIEVETKESIKFTSKQISLEGILFLNAKDVEHHMYILKNAKVIE